MLLSSSKSQDFEKFNFSSTGPLEGVVRSREPDSISLSLLLFTTCPSVRQKSLLRVTISTKRNLLPPCERGRLEKGSLLFLILLNFTPLLSPPLLLPPLKFSVESLSAGHASPVTWCLTYTTRMVAYPHLSTHSFWNITWNDLIFCTGALLSMPYGSTVGKINHIMNN